MRHAAEEANVGAYLLTRVEDVGYMTGFTGDDSFALLGRDWAVLITDGRYGEQAADECRGMDVHVRTAAMSAAISDVLRGRRVRRLGVQGDHVTIGFQAGLAKALGRTRIVSLSDVPGALRAVKDAEEIRAIRRAVRAAETAMLGLLAGGAKGMVGRSEGEVAAELDYRMRLCGASANSFETIVAAGANASRPHYRPSGQRIGRDQAVLIDWGAMVGGYCSDLTRVVFTGRIPPKIGEIYEVVLRAQAAGIAAVRSGAACKTVDAAARDVIAAAGYGERFVHGLGHGIGRMIHEGPRLGRPVSDRLRKGMVVTVEPGIYLPGVGGVRIEDDVLVTSQGRQRLSSLPSRLAEMVLR